MTEMIDTDGTKIPAPIDFCPDVLYNFSTLITQKEPALKD
jgi:hypothetical protein